MYIQIYHKFYRYRNLNYLPLKINGFESLHNIQQKCSEGDATVYGREERVAGENYIIFILV